MKRKTQFLLFSFIIIPYIFVLLKVPSDFRNGFFYADIYNTRHILQTGHIAQNFDAVVFDYWAKIYNRAKTPVVPVMTAIFVKVTGLDLSVIDSNFPWYIFMFLFYFIVLRQFVSTKTSLIVSLIGSIGVPMAPGAVTIRSIKYPIFIFYIFLSTLYWRSGKRNIKAAVPIMISMVFVWLFFFYPRLFAGAAIHQLVIFVVSKRSPTEKIHQMLSPLVVSGVLFLQIFELPLPSYRSAFVTLMTSFYGLNVNIFSFFSSSGSVPTSTLNTVPWSIITVVITVPLGLIGGILVIKRGVLKTKIGRENGIWGIGVLWGVSTFIYAAIHLFATAGWVVSRVFTVAFPVVLLGVAVASEQLRSRATLQNGVLLILLLSTATPFVGYMTSDWVGIHTYPPQSEETTDWGINHVPDNIVTDLTVGARFSSRGNFEAVYPQSEAATTSIFYSRDPRVFEESMRDNNFRYLLLYRDMVNYGFFVPKNPRKPMSETSYNMRVTNYSRIYSSGETSIIIVES